MTQWIGNGLRTIRRRRESKPDLPTVMTSAEAMDALKNNGAFTILSDIIKRGYAKREKGTDRTKTIPAMLENGLLEEVEPTEEMMKYIRFSDEQHKQDYIDKMYFLDITDKGRLAFELLKFWREAQA